MIQTLEKLLRGRWSELLPGRPTPQKLRTALLATSREVAGTRILLLFADHEPAPAMVGKVPRHPQKTAALEREWALLNLLHQDMPEGLLGTLPRPLESLTLHGLPVYLQTALPGQNLKTCLQRRERPLNGEQTHLDLVRMGQWLQLFQQLPVPDPLPAGLEVPREPSLVDALTAVLPALVQGSAEQSLLTEARAEVLLQLARQLDEAMTSRCWVHGDLWPGNVLVSHERWSVLDWDGLSIGSPWQDQVWFALHYGMLVHAQLIGREDLQEGLRRTLFMQHPVSDAIVSYLRHVVHVEGLEGGAARAYVGLMLAIEAGRVLSPGLGNGISGGSRRRAFDLAAPVLLREWEGYPEQIRL